MEIVLEGEKIEYALRVSRRARRIRLAIKPGGALLVTVPRAASRAQVEDFMLRNTRWVIQGIESAKKFPHTGSLKGTHQEYRAHKESARTLAVERMAHFSEVYKITWGKISIRNQSSRWGSCSKKGNLNFNYKIALLPPHLADYVIVHELCHLKEFNHSQKFWDLVAETIPYHREARKQLTKIHVAGS